MSKYPEEYYAAYYPWRTSRWDVPGVRFAAGRALVRDKAYLPLWRQTHSVEALEQAGFFMDGLSQEEVRRYHLFSTDAQQYQWPWMALPNASHVAALDASKEWVVLLSTGSFAPMHHGHLEMMQVAEQKALSLGWEVVGCYFSPSHDAYVKYKGKGEGKKFPANLRSDYAQQLIEEFTAKKTPWLLALWESLALDRPVNFTAVMHHLSHYLSTQLNHPVRVVYVFGADNAGFSEILPVDQRIVVTRPGYSTPVDGHVAFLENPLSSTLKRETWKHTQQMNQKGCYVFRDEGLWATQTWKDKAPKSVLLSAWEEFKQDVIGAILGAYQTFSVRPSYVTVMDLNLQRQQVKKWVEDSPWPLVNLDICTSDIPGQWRLDFCRYFSLDGQQSAPLRFASRFNVPEADEWPSSLTQVVLVDDDAVSGYTLHKAQQWLSEKGIAVHETRLIFQERLMGAEVFDVVDLRDFLPQSHCGGLVVEHPLGQTFRCPYLSPMVNLVTRASLPWGTSWEVSKNILIAAQRFYAAIGADEPEEVKAMAELLQVQTTRT